MNLTLSEDTSYNITVVGSASGGPDDSPISLNGTVTGNLAVLTGTQNNGQQLSLFAWWHADKSKLEVVDQNGYPYGALARK